MGGHIFATQMTSLTKSKIWKIYPGTLILVTTEVVGLYSDIPHESGLNAIKEALENRERKPGPTSDILKMLKFVLKTNYFGFNRKVK